MEFDLERLIRIVRRWGIWLAILAVIGASAGLLVSSTRPVDYAATSTLLLSPTGPTFGFDVNEGLQNKAETYRFLLGTEPFLTTVIDDLGLDPATGVGQLQGAMSLGTSQAVPTIGITITGTDPARTAAWANGIADGFLSYVQLIEFSNTGGTAPWVGVSIPEPATVPTAPVSPSRPLWGALGGILGLLLAATAILVIENLRSAAPAIGRRRAALPVLAVIDAIPRRGTADSLAIDPGGATESGRGIAQLRAAVQILTATQGIRSLAIGSLRPGEGKSTVAANLAIALAEAGDRVILIDANLAAPRLSSTFGGRAARGLTSLMADPDLDLAAVVTSTTWPNLMVIPAGPRGDDSLIDRNAFRRTLAGIVPHADLVIFETPTLIGTPERLRFSSHADGLLLVVGGDRTRIEALRSVTEEKVVADGNVVGVVVDRGVGGVVPLTAGVAAPAGLTLIPSTPPVATGVGAMMASGNGALNGSAYANGTAHANGVAHPNGTGHANGTAHANGTVPVSANGHAPAVGDANGMVRTQRAVPLSSEQEAVSAGRPGATG